ncbi:MAG: ferredoxin-type protein NapF [Gammaproteobacteria bacterium]
MTTAINRADFLHGVFYENRTTIRPPWAIAEVDFISACNHCGDCVKCCPTQIIRMGRGQYPVIDFESGECLFCDECLNACHSGAITRTPEALPWSISARIDEHKCIAFQQVECRSCFDPCENRAIRMQYRINSTAVPIIDASCCNGCGACYSTCPVQAIEMKPSSEDSA